LTFTAAAAAAADDDDDGVDDADVSDVKLEDSGNYTCEIRGHRSTVLSHITHSLYVRCQCTYYLLTYSLIHSSVL